MVNTGKALYRTPDWHKGIPVDRASPRERLADSFDNMFAEKINPEYNLDADINRITAWVVGTLIKAEIF